MGRKKQNPILLVFSIFCKSIQMYFKYLDKTSKYMLIPVLGLVLGLVFVFLVSYYFWINIDNLQEIPLFKNSTKNLMFAFGAVLLPFFALFLHSCYRYIIAFCSLNIVFYTLTPKKQVKNIDFTATDKVIEGKLFQYILLMFIVSLLCLCPILWIPLSLSFQIFSLESNTNCFKSVSRSFKLVMENLFAVILMLILVFIFSYWFLPALFIWSLEKISLVDLFVTKTEVYMQIFPYNDWNSILSIAGMSIDSVTIAKYVVEAVLNFIIIGFLLPWRCCCFTELYKNLDTAAIKEYSKESEEIIKRATKRKNKSK